MKWLGRRILGHSAMVYRHCTRDSARILMYHRFATGDCPRRTRIDAFEQQVQFLRRHYHTCTMDQVVAAMAAGSSRKALAAITIDDGYKDFLDLAYPILQHYRVPATLYVVTDFLDGRWLWFDAMHHLLLHAPGGSYRLELAGETRTIRLSTKSSRESAWNDLGDLFVAMPTDVREEALGIVQRAIGCMLPGHVTDSYASLSWDEVRSLDPTLVEIGSHTCSHPILSRCTSARINVEVAASKARLEFELSRPVRSFAYPNGQPTDYTSLVTAAVERAGYSNAVVAHGSRAGSNSSRFRLERLGVPTPYMEFRNAIDWAR